MKTRKKPMVKLFMTALLQIPLMSTAFGAEGVSCDAYRCSISIHESLAIESGVSDFYGDGDRYEMIGDLIVKTPAGNVPLLDAELYFSRNTDNTDIGFEVYGVAEAPFPSVPLLAGASFTAKPLAAVGLAGRKMLKSLLESDGYTLPLAENPKDPEGDPNDIKQPAYLFFHFQSGLAFDMPLNALLGMNQEGDNPFNFSVPGDKSVTFILDLEEPYFFISQNARELVAEKSEAAIDLAKQANEEREKEREQQNGGDTKENNDAVKGAASETAKSALPDLGDLAFSFEGGIPFRPKTIWGIPEGAGEFKGHLYIETELPLYKFVKLNGEIVTYIGKEGYMQGGNGKVEVSFDLIPNFLNFSFPLGNATAGVTITKDEQATYFSGINDPNYSFLPSFVPFTPANKTLVSGYISSANPVLTQLRAKGQFGYDTAGLSKLVGVNLNNLAVNSADLTVTVEGIRLRGRTSSSIHPSIKLGGSVDVDIFFPFTRPELSYVRMSGQMQVAGVGLSPVALDISAKGFFINGKFVTPLSEIGMGGQITNQGPLLTGNAGIYLPIGDITAALNKAREGVLKAEQKVQEAGYLVDQARKQVQADRDRDAANLEKARAEVVSAQNGVKSLQSKINYQNGLIKKYNGEIAAKKRWYNKKPWHKKPAAWIAYTGYRTYKLGQIGVAKTAIAGLNVAMAAAKGVLWTAEQVLYGIQQGISTLPIDLDPRVSGLIIGLESAKAALKVAKLALPDLPVIDLDVGGKIDLTLDIKGIRGNLSAQMNGQSLADGKVAFDPMPKACVNISKLGEFCTPF